MTGRTFSHPVMKDNMAERLRSLITIYAHFFRIILSPDKRNSFASDLYDNCIFHLKSSRLPHAKSDSQKYYLR